MVDHSKSGSEGGPNPSGTTAAVSSSSGGQGTASGGRRPVKERLGVRQDDRRCVHLNMEILRIVHFPVVVASG